MFKPGDRVTVTDKYPFKNEDLIGKSGTVICVDGTIWPVEVVIDDIEDHKIFNFEELRLESDCPSDDN